MSRSWPSDFDKSFGDPARRSIFNRYARLFRIVLSRWIPIYEEGRQGRELDELTLPSNEDWRQRVYYRLVDLQRECDAEIASKRNRSSMESSLKSMSRESRCWEWTGWASRTSRTSACPLRAKRSTSETYGTNVLQDISGSMTEACVEPGWRINDILLAAKVLQRVLPRPAYANEAETRRVFGLVYDVLRYKDILNKALDDVGFWRRNDGLRNRRRIVWLLLYDLQGRKFARRGDITAIQKRERIFKSAGLKDIEDALLEAKTHLAASVSRLRIGGSARNIDELLPIELRVISGVRWTDEGSIASGWMNQPRNDFIEEMSRLNFVLHEEKDHVESQHEDNELEETSYVFDPFCPNLVNFHEAGRETLAVSDLVREHRFVFLERSLCFGAATLAQAIRLGRFCGPVILTHSLAPRHTSYLAGLLSDLEDAGRLLAFGAKERRAEYESHLLDLGLTVQHCRVFSEEYISPPPSAELERATVVLAIPPCSYTGVKDIVDLAIARGGDLDLLESLTGTSGTSTRKDDREKRTNEQLATLKYALTRPNVQFLIYEAHTILPEETTEMVTQVVDYANRMAVEKYVREHPPRRRPSPKSGEGKVSKSAKSIKSTKSTKSEKSGMSYQSQDEDDASFLGTDVTIPESDLFEVGSISDIYGTSTIEPGCFLAVIKRKEMMQFNSLFMIKVAESKGLFGDPTEQERPRREPIVQPVVRPSSQTARRSAKRPKISIERIMAPTYSTMSRISKGSAICPRSWRCREDEDPGKDVTMVQVYGSKTKSLMNERNSVDEYSLESCVRTFSCNPNDLRGKK